MVGETQPSAEIEIIPILRVKKLRRFNARRGVGASGSLRVVGVRKGDI
jgi:hypothetical protein